MGEDFSAKVRARNPWMGSISVQAEMFHRPRLDLSPLRGGPAPHGLRAACRHRVLGSWGAGSIEWRVEEGRKNRPWVKKKP